jgi:hypothetical protein
MKLANHFQVELPEVLSELPVKFARIERVYCGRDELQLSVKF